ncbi:MAG: GDSL-type esterase/lipase family protein [Planctomycetota bacterium]
MSFTFTRARVFSIILLAGLSASACAIPPATPARPTHSAVTPVARADAEWQKRHESFNARALVGSERGDIGVLFIGDSITQGWGDAGKSVWERHYAPRRAVNFGIGGDRTQHVLWRLEHGNLAGLARPTAAGARAPKLAVVMIGTNNSNGDDNTAEEIADGITAIVALLRAELPQTKVLLLAIFPRGEAPNPQREKNRLASARAAKIADGVHVHALDIGAHFLDKDAGILAKEIMPDALHLSTRGYEIWAAAMEPKLRELLAE